MTSVPKRLRAVAASVIVIAIAVAGGFKLANNSENSAGSELAQTEVRPLETSTVTRQTLSESESFDASVGHGESTPLPIDAQGTVTWAPKKDTILSPGDIAIRINERPVTIAQGEVPLYRELRQVGATERDVAGDKLGLQEGMDVTQLQAFLLGEGFDDKGRLEADGTFGTTTKRAVKEWQESVAHPATGRVDRTQLIFVSQSVRVDSSATVGQSFTELRTTDSAETVTGNIKSEQRSFFPEGAVVQVDVDGQTAEGTVKKVSSEIGGDGSTRYTVEVELDSESLLQGVETVEVSASKVVAADVLTVPVRALLALSEGGWAVEVSTDTGTSLQRIELGTVVDTTAVVSGVDEGTQIVVPA